MKIIHCADLHLDSTLTTNLTKEKAKTRNLELLKTFQRMVQYAAENRISAILIAGDMFDSKTVSATTKNAVISTISEYQDIKFYYLKGNHDTYNDIKQRANGLDNLLLFNEDWTTDTLGETGADNSTSADNLASSKKIKITGLEFNQNTADNIYDSLSLDSNDINIVMLHGQEVENTNSKDKTEIINRTALKDKGIDYLALGHIHMFKEGELDGRGKWCYSGCLEGRGFDECGDHGFVLLDIDEDTGEVKTLFVPFAYRKLYAPTVDISGCMTSTEIITKIKNELNILKYDKSSLIKIVLVGEVDFECEKDLEYITSEFENKYYFVKIYDETKLVIDYNIFALDESLKGEFVRLVQALDIEENMKAEIIKCGIRALRGEAIE